MSDIEVGDICRVTCEENPDCGGRFGRAGNLVRVLNIFDRVATFHFLVPDIDQRNVDDGWNIQLRFLEKL